MRRIVESAVAGAWKMLGIDPLHVANEGKLVAAVPRDEADRPLDALRSIPAGAKASQIGKAVARMRKAVSIQTRYGGQRLVELPYGEESPRIC